MPSGFGKMDTVHGPVSYFHDSPGCLPGKEHDWTGFRNFWDHCKDPTHETDEDHGPECESGFERVCAHCGMGAMHHSLMTGD